MAEQGDIERVWKLMNKIGICMLASHDGRLIRGRPMAAHVDREENCIYFLTDADSHKDEEIERDPTVAVFFADTSGQNYVALSGDAVVSDDRAKIKELWSTPAKAWWDDPEDPSIRVLKVTPRDAQYWDGPGTIAAYAKMAVAAMTSGTPDMGDQAKVRM